MKQSKKGNFPDQIKFEGSGVDYKCKLIGYTDVSAPRGDEICIATLSSLKDAAFRSQRDRKEHKQKIVLNITLKGIRLIDENTERIDHAHPISRISFISLDKYDKRIFGYIVSTKDGYKLFAIKTMKEAEVITATIKELFQEVYRRCVEKRQAESGNTNSCGEKNGVKKDVPHKDVPHKDVPSKHVPHKHVPHKHVPHKHVSHKEVEITCPSDESQPRLDTENGNGEVMKRCDPFDDNFTPLANRKHFNLLDDLDNVSFGDPFSTSLFSTEPNQSHHEQSENQLTQIKLDELKKNIDEMHKQNIMQKQRQKWMTEFPPPTNQHAPVAINIPDPYGTYASNPFLNDSFADAPNPIPTGEIIEQAYSYKNPFSSPQLPFNSDIFVRPATGFPDFNPSALDPKEIGSQHISTLDPFSFLDNRSTVTTVSAPIPPGGINHSAANKELLDLLG